MYILGNFVACNKALILALIYKAFYGFKSNIGAVVIKIALLRLGNLLADLDCERCAVAFLE